MAEQKTASLLEAPLHGAASVLRKVPGAGVVGRAAQETLDKVGAVSPRSRRIAVYTGAGVLAAAGVVEWPVALTGAAVAWLTQPRPERTAQERASDRSAHDGRPGRPTAEEQTEQTEAAAPGGGPGTGPKSGTASDPGDVSAADHPDKPTPRRTSRKQTPGQAATGPLGPTARPSRTTR
ncbi:hypothetical protein ACPCJU_06600 [Streptomyces thermodiastaticus]